MLNIFHQAARCGRQDLFASLSQLNLLWQNDIYIVQIMEKILREPIAEYEPLKR